MCGILVTHGLEQPFHHGLLKGLRKRGPDAVGFWSDQRIHLGHTRLAILGLDERGTQPIENQHHVIAYNGEIYNFSEINERLKARGIRVAGTSDTEVLLYAWTEWGPDILCDLSGFWAFVIYEKATRKLFLCRDQLGVKPLYYWVAAGKCCVSSLIRTILDTVGESADLDMQAMSEYVRYQFTFGDKTFIRQIKKVPPGHVVELCLDGGSVISTCYEDILRAENESGLVISPSLIQETKALLVECCRESTISDTSFTTFCSGGLDSSLITSITRPEVAYHCNYSDPDCNETFYAREVVAHTPTRLMVVNAADSFNLVDRLSELIEDFDELTIGSVILPLEDLLTQVKRRYKVILTGTGGDELFAGYVRYQLALGHCFQDSYRALYEKMQAVERVPDRFEMTHQKGNPELYTFYDSAVETTFRDHFEMCRNGGCDLSAMLTFDRRYFLQGLLNIEDKMCGRHSLESRPSFLHQKLVRHVLRISSQSLLGSEELKHLLRHVACGYLPESVIRRSDKMGFTTPIGTFVNRSAHNIREQLTNSRFKHFYNLKTIHLTADTKFSREVFEIGRAHV